MKRIVTFLTLLFCISIIWAQNAPIIDVFGDSYVANHARPYQESWHYKMAQQLGMTYKNIGKNGACIAFDRTHDVRGNFGPAMYAKTKMLDPNADYVLIIAGHNDAVKIGLNKDSLQMFTDSLELLISNIKAQCPNAKLGWVTPWYVDKPGFDPVCNVIKKVCRRNHIPVLWNDSKKCVIKVRDGQFRAKYFQHPRDTAHLNADGHDLFLPVAMKWFKNKVMK